MARKGYSAFGDIMRTTADGRPLADLFAELNAAAEIHNEHSRTSCPCSPTRPPAR